MIEAPKLIIFCARSFSGSASSQVESATPLSRNLEQLQRPLELLKPLEHISLLRPFRPARHPPPPTARCRPPMDPPPPPGNLQEAAGAHQVDYTRKAATAAAAAHAMRGAVPALADAETEERCANCASRLGDSEHAGRTLAVAGS